MSARLRGIDDLFRHAERVTSLLVRTRPRGVARLRARLLERWASGDEQRPALEYARPPDLSELRRDLEAAERSLDGAHPIAALYAARARELALEARIVEAVGTSALGPLARERFGKAMEGTDQARRWASEWLAGPERSHDDGEPLHASDDERVSASLVSQLRSMIGSARLPVRVEINSELLANAAAGEGVVCIRGGVMQREPEARRTALHELEGHALPRLRAREHALGLFAVGAAHGSEDEEGRALHIERRAGLFDARRRATLARRHLAAEAVHEGADFVETARLALARGARLAEAIDIALRCQRGGGLARELAYLPALARFEAAVASGFDADGWLGRGRLSLEAARQLAALGASVPHRGHAPNRR